jgi:hypothetical protein
MALTYDESNNKPIAYDLATNEVIYYTDKEGTNEAVGNFEVIPDFQQGFENVYAFGSSGSGKSYFTADYAMQYRRMYPKKNIFMFSQKTSDISFEERKDEEGKKIDIKNILKIRRIKVDDEFLHRDIDILKDFNDCLLIFDDFMYFENKKVVEKICNIVTQILNLGRTKHIYCIITAHLLYQIKNRDMYMNIQNEIHKLVFFKGVNVFQLTYCLRNYWGFSKKQINNLLRVDTSSRFICINKNPSYVITKHRVILL